MATRIAAERLNQFQQKYDRLIQGVLVGAVAGGVGGRVIAAERGAASATELLMPGGSPIGTAGSRAAIRELSGGTAEASQMFGRLTRGASDVTPAGYPGTLMELPTGGTVGMRTVMSRSPGTAATIDVNIPNVPIEKIKFNP